MLPLLLLAQVWPADPLLDQIRRKMAANVKALPNYTCTETIERTIRRPAAHKPEPVDKLRLEIAYVGDQELVAWPGSDKFGDKSIQELAGGRGAIGNGNFALIAHNVFLSSAPRFSPLVEEGKSIRADFEVPLEESTFSVGSERDRATVAYHGSFWADAATLDILRVETHADRIPPATGLKASINVIEYARTPIADSTFLLPAASELIMTDLGGAELHNRVQFTNCHQYVGESVIRFEEPSAAPAPVPAAVQVIELPAGLHFDVKLAAPLRLDGAIGDPVTAILAAPIKKAGQVLFPAGTMLSGRLTRLERQDSMFGMVQVIGLAFQWLDGGGRKAPFNAELVEVGGNSYPPHILRNGTGPSLAPGEGIFCSQTHRPTLPAGLRLRWRTLPKTGR